MIKISRQWFLLQVKGPDESHTPKILHKICGRSMISYTLENLRKGLVGEVVAVVSYRKNLVLKQIRGAVGIAVQKNSKGERLMLPKPVLRKFQKIPRY